MRTAHLATLLAFGLVFSLATVSLPAAAGCSSLVGKPTQCLTAVYESAKGNAQAKLVGAGAWASFFPVYVSACPSMPVIGVQVPGLPGTEAVSVFASDIQDAANGFQAGVAVNVFPATAALISNSFLASMDLALFYSEAFDGMVIPLVPTVPSDPNQIGAPALPTTPDPAGGVDALLVYIGENSDSAQDGANDSATCFQDAPLP